MTGGTVAVIGEQPQVRGYALAGAVVLAADEPTPSTERGHHSLTKRSWSSSPRTRRLT